MPGNRSETVRRSFFHDIARYQMAETAASTMAINLYSLPGLRVYLPALRSNNDVIVLT